MTAIQLTSISAPASAAARGRYDEIVALHDGALRTPAETILSRYRAALPETFVEFDRKNRGDALNVDLYGYDAVQNVAVVQVRHAFRRYRNGFMNVRKDYVLVGFNELTHEPFRHPISAHAIRAAIRKDGDDPKAAVRAAQRWMWSVTEKQLAASHRQGDVLVVPHRGTPAGKPVDLPRVTVADTHEVRALAFIEGEDGLLYAHTPTLVHLKAQHDPVYAPHEGWCSIRVGQEAPTWSWSERLGD